MKVTKKDHYEVGDRVHIRDWDDMAKEYGLDSDGFITVGNFDFAPDMRIYCGSEMVIKDFVKGFSQECCRMEESGVFPVGSIAGVVEETPIEAKIREAVNLAAQTKNVCDELCDMVTGVPDDDIYELITRIQEGSATDVDEIMAHLKTKGYGKFVFADVPIPLLHIEKLDDSRIFETDLEAAEQAERDGVKIIYDVPIPQNSFCKPYEGTFVDTEENRNNLIRFLLEEMSVNTHADNLYPSELLEAYRKQEKYF